MTCSLVYSKDLETLCVLANPDEQLPDADDPLRSELIEMQGSVPCSFGCTALAHVRLQEAGGHPFRHLPT